MASDNELPDIPNLPREDSNSKRTLSSTSLTSEVGHQERSKAKKVTKGKGKTSEASSSSSRSRSRRPGERNAYKERQKQWLNESRSRETSEQRVARQAADRTLHAAASSKDVTLKSTSINSEEFCHSQVIFLDVST